FRPERQTETKTAGPEGPAAAFKPPCARRSGARVEALAAAGRTRCRLAGVRMRMRAAVGGLAMATGTGLARGALATGPLLVRTLGCPPTRRHALLATTVLRDRGVEADRARRFEAVDRLHHDLGLEHALDLAQQAALLRCHQRKRLARRAVAAGAADAVHVVL